MVRSRRLPCYRQTDQYVIYDRGWFWRDEAQARALGGRPEQVGYKVTAGSYSATEYALEHVVDDRQLRMPDHITCLHSATPHVR